MAQENRSGKRWVNRTEFEEDLIGANCIQRRLYVLRRTGCGSKLSWEEFCVLFNNSIMAAVDSDHLRSLVVADPGRVTVVPMSLLSPLLLAMEAHSGLY